MDKRKRLSVGPQRSKFTPVHRTPSAPRRKSTASIPTMDKNSMFVMEANEIVQCLQKDYVFEMKDNASGDESTLRVRVRNTQTKLVCVWTLAKLKERLVKMRKLMYADDAESQGIGGDTVFYDAADVWITQEEESATAAPTVEPTAQQQQQQQDNSTTKMQQNKLPNANSVSHSGNKIVNGNHNNADYHSNNRDAHINTGIATLSNEAALPSVSVSVGFQSTQNTMKLPNGLPDSKSLNQNNNGLSSTASSELPAESEFLGMSLTSTIGSPMSPPPPPKDFGQNSAVASEAVEPGRSAGGVLPVKYLTSSPGQGMSHVAGSPQGGAVNHSGHERPQTQQSRHNTGLNDPGQQASHRPIIKSRSPNVTPAPSALKNSRKMKPRDSAISFNMDVQNNTPLPGGVSAKEQNQSRDSRPVKAVSKHLSHSLNYAQPTNTRVSPNMVRRDLPSRDSLDSHKHQQRFRDSIDGHQQTHHHKNVAFSNEQSNVCQHCKGANSMEVSRDLRITKKNKRTISALRMCRDMVKTLSYRSKGGPRNDTIVDRIMYNCESVKIAVINILEAYTQAQDSRNDMALFADSELVKLTSMQLVSSMELLVSHTSLWCATFDGEETEFMKEASTRITNTVRDLGKVMVLFLQACETDNDTLASDSATKIIDLLYDLIKFCGELAVTTNTCPLLLIDRRKNNGLDELLALKHQREDDLLHIKPSMDMKQSLLGGCDVWLDTCIDSSIRTIQDCELRAQMLSEDCYASQESGTEVAKHAYITATTTKILLLKCQEMQVDISATMKEETTKEENYFQQYFVRCEGMVQQVTTLVDSVSLLSQATEPLIDEEESSTLRKISRCSEMIFKATNKLVISSNFDLSQSGIPETPRSLASLNGISLDMRTDDLEFSNVIGDSQSEQIDHCGEDVKLATQALCSVIRRRLPSNENNNTGSKMKRMLPATPGVVSGGRPMLRCKSAKQAERMRRSLSSYDVNTKKSNEI